MIIKYAIALGILLILIAFAAWAFLPARHLPGNRARHLRIRLHLRLHPGKGFAHLFSLWLRWGRLAALRRSGRIRRSLPLWYRITDPRTHSVFLGRAHYRHGLRVPLEEHLLVMAPPRTFKTASPQGANSRRHPSTALRAGRFLSERKRPHSGDPAASLALTLTKPGSPVTFSDGSKGIAHTSLQTAIRP